MTNHITDDPLAQSVVTLIRKLVDGNSAVANDVEVEALARTDRNVTLILDVGLSWASDSEVLRGAQEPSGSARCVGAAGVTGQMQRECDAIAADPVVSAALAEKLRRAPSEEFRTLKDKFKVRDLSNRYHYHQQCTNCRGHGEHACRHFTCIGGKVTCTACGGDGKHRCNSCLNGQVGVTVSVQDYHGNWSSRTDYTTCRQCNGTSRTGSCYSNCLYGKVSCPECNGTALVSCGSCAASGWFTHHYWTWINGSVKRTWAFSNDAPTGFKQSAEALGITTVPGLHGDTLSTAVTAGARACRIKLDCTLTHVHGRMRCNGYPIIVDAVGRDASIPRMPPFLDLLLKEVGNKLSARATTAAQVINTAQSARLPRTILQLIATGAAVEPERIVTDNRGAITQSLVDSFHVALDKAYHQLGRGAVRRTWLVAAPLLIGTAIVSALYDGAALLPVRTDILQPADWAIVGLPLLAVWFVAGRLGRQGARSVVGKVASRRTRQGIWPWLIGALALGLHAVVLQSPFDAMVLKLPFAPTASPAKVAMADYVVRRALLTVPRPARDLLVSFAATIGLNLPDFGKEGLLPSAQPPLLTKSAIPESQMPGLPGAWKLQSALAQLGFYHGPLDGSRPTPNMKQSLEAMLEAIPDYRSAHIQESFNETAEKVLAGTIRLSLPADKSLAAGLSNLARGNLTADDLTRLTATAERASHNIGQEQYWRSADAKRGGRLIATAPDTNAARRCVWFSIEIEIDGAVERGGPIWGCAIAGRWVPQAT